MGWVGSKQIGCLFFVPRSSYVKLKFTPRASLHLLFCHRSQLFRFSFWFAHILLSVEWLFTAYALFVSHSRLILKMRQVSCSGFVFSRQCEKFPSIFNTLQHNLPVLILCKTMFYWVGRFHI